MIPYKEIPKRLKQVSEMRTSGKTFREIGESLNVSTERARQLYSKYNVLIRYNNQLEKEFNSKTFYAALIKTTYELHKPECLCNRAYYCLCQMGIMDEISDDIFALNKYSDDDLLQIRSLGVNCVELIRKANEFYIKEHMSSIFD